MMNDDKGDASTAVEWVVPRALSSSIAYPLSEPGAILEDQRLTAGNRYGTVY